MRRYQLIFYESKVKLESLNPQELNIIKSVWKESPYGLIRQLMSIDEIKLANILVKKGFLVKETSTTKQKNM